jgi:hypothetical protein
LNVKVNVKGRFEEGFDPPFTNFQGALEKRGSTWAVLAERVEPTLHGGRAIDEQPEHRDWKHEGVRVIKAGQLDTNTPRYVA